MQMAGIGRRSPPNAAGIPESSETTTMTAKILVDQVATTTKTNQYDIMETHNTFEYNDNTSYYMRKSTSLYKVLVV